MSVCRIARCDGGVDVVVVFGDKALRLCAGDVAAEAINLLLHLGVLGAFADALEVGLDLALELEAVTPGATLEGLLHDITAQLLRLSHLVSF
jgi:hypothetical protein